LVLPFLAVLLFGFGCSRGVEFYTAAPLLQMERERAYFRTAPVATMAFGAPIPEMDWGAGHAPPAFRDMPVLAETHFNIGEETAATFANEDLPQRRLVRRADMRIRVESLELADNEIGDLMRRYGAFSSSSSITETMRMHTIRVPSNLYDSFVASVSGIGRVLQRTESTEDVTLRYFDLEGRLATQRELLETFRSYLGRAANIDEILSVEARIADLQSSIDRTGRDLRHLGDLVDYSTVSLSIEWPPAPGAFVGPTLPERLGDLFSGFGRFLSGALLFAIGLVIYGIPVLLALAFLYWLLLGRIGLLKRLFRLASSKPGGKA